MAYYCFSLSFVSNNLAAYKWPTNYYLDCRCIGLSGLDKLEELRCRDVQLHLNVLSTFLDHSYSKYIFTKEYVSLTISSAIKNSHYDVLLWFLSNKPNVFTTFIIEMSFTSASLKNNVIVLNWLKHAYEQNNLRPQYNYNVIQYAIYENKSIKVLNWVLENSELFSEKLSIQVWHLKSFIEKQENQKNHHDANEEILRLLHMIHTKILLKHEQYEITSHQEK